MNGLLAKSKSIGLHLASDFRSVGTYQTLLPRGSDTCQFITIQNPALPSRPQVSGVSESAGAHVLGAATLLRICFGLHQPNWRQVTMRTFSKNWSGIDPPSAIPKSVHYVFWGAAIGVIGGLVTLLTTATYFGAMSGLSATECAAFGSLMTVMLSQPAGLAGLLVGAACGGTCAIFARHLHRSRSES